MLANSSGLRGNNAADRSGAPAGVTGMADSFYADVPQQNWFEHHLKRFDTVKINACFYAWPTAPNIQAWRRQSGIVYTVKVCELITHVKRFKATRTLIRVFGII